MVIERRYHLELTEYESMRMRSDLELASNLSVSLAPKYLTVLDGGYGVDAVCGGQLTRFHHDLDLIVFRQGEDINSIRRSIGKSLENFDRRSNWIEHETAPGWIWFTSESPVAPGVPRHINIHVMCMAEESVDAGWLLVRSRKGKEYQMGVQRATIEDINGSTFDFITLISEEYAASKLRLIPKYAPTWKIRESDQHDLFLLFRAVGLDFGKCVNILDTYFKAMSNQKRPDENRSSATNHLSRFILNTHKYSQTCKRRLCGSFRHLVN